MSQTLKWISLVVMMLQNAVTPIIFRYATTSEKSSEAYSTTVAVSLQEFIKLIFSFFLLILESSNSVKLAVETVYQQIIMKPMDTVKLAIPAILYFVQNILLQKASANLPAALFQVTYQGKTLVVAFFSVFLLSKQLTRFKWLAIFLMGLGIAIVQLAHSSESKQQEMKNRNEQSVTKGLIFVLMGCFCSGFAGVYFEKMMKFASSSSTTAGTSSAPPSMWIRNMQLAAFSMLIGVFPIMFESTSSVNASDSESNSLLRGFNSSVWLMVMNNAIGGLCVAFVIKYADNILKGFACALATILATIASVPLFGFQLNLAFFTGMIIVIGSTLMYGDAVKIGGEFWNSEPQVCKSVRNDYQSVSVTADIEKETDFEKVPLRTNAFGKKEANGETKVVKS